MSDVLYAAHIIFKFSILYAKFTFLRADWKAYLKRWFCFLHIAYNEYICATAFFVIYYLLFHLQ